MLFATMENIKVTSNHNKSVKYVHLCISKEETFLIELLGSQNKRFEIKVAGPRGTFNLNL